MKKRIYFSVVFTFLLLFGSTTFAQQKTEIKKESFSKQEKNEAELYQLALAAKQKGEFEKALFLLNDAYKRNKNALYLFERALVLEQMGEREFALGVLDENMEVLKNHPDITNLALTRERIAEMKTSDVKEDPEDKASLVGPILIVTGAATIITGVILLVLSYAAPNDARCEGTIANPSCENPTKESSIADVKDKLESAQTLNIAGWGIAGAGLILTGRDHINMVKPRHFPLKYCPLSLLERVRVRDFFPLRVSTKKRNLKEFQ